MTDIILEGFSEEVRSIGKFRLNKIKKSMQGYQEVILSDVNGSLEKLLQFALKKFNGSLLIDLSDYLYNMTITPR